MKQALEEAIANAVKELFSEKIEIELSRPEEKFGDYATNAALQLANKHGKNPREVAEALVDQLREQLKESISEVSVAGPGFINLKLSDQALIKAAHADMPVNLSGQEILVEFGDPNPFKEMHIGHVYSYIVGDAISRLLEANGAKVHRLSYHGDVGLHVAKAIWGMQQAKAEPGALDPDISAYYQAGAAAYEKDEKARDEVHKINEAIYSKQDSEVNHLYEWGRQLSFDYFDAILKELDVKTDKRYFESETAEIGSELVRKHTGNVFTESDGATVFEGEKVGLHTRVFITSKGLPTYETKDLGLAEIKRRDYPNADRSIIITANEQGEYFKVMLAALKEFDKDLALSITHLTHGFVSLSTGKMSSRTGNVYSGATAVENIDQEMKKRFPASTNATRNAAIKYDFLKNRLGSDIVFDLEKSFSLEGNSGPYLQYAHARARSILAKAEGGKVDGGLEADERSLLRKISEFTEVEARATDELMPHHICTYLYELAQNFNRFYEKNRVIGDARQDLRLGLVAKYADTLKQGLNLLGIEAPDKM